MKHFLILFLISLILPFHCKNNDNPTLNTSDSSLPGEGLPYFTPVELNPVWPKTAEERNQFAIQIPKFTFQDQEGKEYGSQDIKGHVTIVSFFFTRCSGICPNLTRKMKKVQDALSKETNLRMISFSVTPDLDDKKSLEEFSKKHGIQPKIWHLLSGPKAELYPLARNSFFADTPTNASVTKDDFVHSENVYLLDKNLYIRGVYNGLMGDQMADLLKDTQHLLSESKN
jgi:protein SCO1/2